jgi:hypothetical protein
MKIGQGFRSTVSRSFIRSVCILQLLLDVTYGLLALGVVVPRVVVQLLDLIVLRVSLLLLLLLFLLGPLGWEVVETATLLVD